LRRDVYAIIDFAIIFFAAAFAAISLPPFRQFLLTLITLIAFYADAFSPLMPSRLPPSSRFLRYAERLPRVIDTPPYFRHCLRHATDIAAMMR